MPDGGKPLAIGLVSRLARMVIQRNHPGLANAIAIDLAQILELDGLVMRCHRAITDWGLATLQCDIVPSDRV